LQFNKDVDSTFVYRVTPSSDFKKYYLSYSLSYLSAISLLLIVAGNTILGALCLQTDRACFYYSSRLNMILRTPIKV